MFRSPTGIEGTVPLGGSTSQPVSGTGGPSSEASAFETAINSLDPIAWYRFRDSDFSTQIADSSGNSRHLVKQIATAVRSSVPSRTTHPGGAYFPSVTMTNWASTGTLYLDAAESLLSGATEYTIIASVRYQTKHTYAAPFKTFGLGTDGAADEFVTFGVEVASSGDAAKSEHLDSAVAQRAITSDVTENIWDGVNRLYIVRFKQNTIHRMTSSKPGYTGLTEANGASTINALTAVSKTLMVNGRNANVTGATVTPGFVVDQLALLDYDIGATAETSLHTKWASEAASAGYYPSTMDFDGSTGYYSLTFAPSANAVTFVAKFNIASFSGTSRLMYLGNVNGSAGIYGALLLASSDFSTADYRNKLLFIAQNATPTNICRVISASELTDGQDHTVFASYDATAGTVVLRVDGADEDDTENASRILTTGTLATGSSTTFVGAGTASTHFVDGEIGFFGMREAYLTNWSDFMEADGTIKPIDESGWTEWGAQPAFWSHTGEMTINRGSAGDMTENGTITRTIGGSP